MSVGIERIGFLQLPVVAGESRANVALFEQTLQEHDPQPATLMVLPELWAGGFCYDTIGASAAETPRLLERLAREGEQRGCLFAASFAEEEAGQIYNSLYLCGAGAGEGGVAGPTRKQYLFPGEERSFTAADTPPQLLTAAGTEIGAFICFDLRFPEIARSLSAAGAELLLCSAQWPQARIDHWLALLTARAIENQCFVVACNGCGESAGIGLGGHSVVISPFGQIVACAGEEREAADVPFERQLMEEMRSRYVSWHS